MKMTWIDACNGEVPDRSLVVGLEDHNEYVYIGRAWHGNKLLPGKVNHISNILFCFTLN